MKKRLSLMLIVALMAMMVAGPVAGASSVDYGASGASTKTNYTLEEMLTYAIQDEYLARAEYDKIMDVFGSQRPFSNIIKAENTHVDLLEPLFGAYKIDIPQDTADKLTVVPATLTEAFETGVQAEIDNIAMYNKFLSQELPDDVREVFTELRNASENHLKAFENGLSRNNGSQMGKNRW